VCELSCPGALKLRPDHRCRIQAVLSVKQALTGLVSTKPRPLLLVSRGRAGAEQISRLLTERLGERIPFYHYGLNSEERADLRRFYFRRRDAAMVVPPTAGGELTRSDLRTLIHTHLPPSVGEYLRVAGWAGRNPGNVEIVLLLAAPEMSTPNEPGSPEPRCPYCPVVRDAVRPARCVRGAPCGDACRFASAYERALRDAPPGYQEIAAAVAANNRSLSPRELCLLLEGKRGFATVGKKLYMYTGYGYLCRWRFEDVAEAVSALLTGGVLRIPARGVWRRRVALTNREARWKIRFRNY
jgi:hypothetical protein